MCVCVTSVILVLRFISILVFIQFLRNLFSFYSVFVLTKQLSFMLNSKFTLVT